MNLDLQGKNALIGGGAQGLGFAAAFELSLLGANCILVSRNEDNLKKAVSSLSITSQGQRHSYIVADYSRPEEAIQIISEKLEESTSVHILINNAGGPPAGNITDLSSEDFENGFKMHFTMSHELALKFIPGMKKEGFGRIINILSVSVKQAINELPVSNMIRSGIASWAKTLSNEVARFGITVNNVLPGYTDTERLKYLFEKRAQSLKTNVLEIRRQHEDSIPAGRLGKPEEFGAVVGFLCSPAAAYVNGINLPVDGGATKSL